MPLGPECSSDNRGTCDASRLPSGQEYRLDVSGPDAAAIHVVDAQAAGAPLRPARLLSGAGYRGVLLERSGETVAVILDDGFDGAPRSSLSYRVPRGSASTHVVLDAPTDANGLSDVASRVDGADCLVVVTPRVGSSDGSDGRGLVVRLTRDCAGTESQGGPPTEPGGAGGSEAGSGGSASNPGGTTGSAGGATGSAGGATGSAGSAAGNPGRAIASAGSAAGGQGGATGSAGPSDPLASTGGTGDVIEGGPAEPSDEDLAPATQGGIPACSASRQRPSSPIPWLGVGFLMAAVAVRRRQASAISSSLTAR
jgi:hypothetical protein